MEPVDLVVREDGSETWLSGYLYFKGDIYKQECDIVLTEVIEPFIRLCKEKQLIKKYFFIRYYDWGSHVRLRMLGDEDYSNDTLRVMMEGHVSSWDDKQIFSFPANVNTKSGLASHLLWIPYIPETERYGGKHAMKLAEDFFFCSSDVALVVMCRQKARDHSARLASGLVSMLVLLHAFMKNKSDSLRFIANYSDGYLSQISDGVEQVGQWKKSFEQSFEKQSGSLANIIETIWDAIDNGTDLQTPWGSLLASAEQLRTDLQTLSDHSMLEIQRDRHRPFSHALNFLVPSYIHMMSNRLGIPIIEESYLAYLIAHQFARCINERR